MAKDRLTELTKHVAGELKLQTRRRDFISTLEEWFSEAEKEGNQVGAQAMAVAIKALRNYSKKQEMKPQHRLLGYVQTLEDWFFQADKEGNDEAAKAFLAGIFALSPKFAKSLLRNQ